MSSDVCREMDGVDYLLDDAEVVKHISYDTWTKVLQADPELIRNLPAGIIDKKMCEAIIDGGRFSSMSYIPDEFTDFDMCIRWYKLHNNMRCVPDKFKKDILKMVDEGSLPFPTNFHISEFPPECLNYNIALGIASEYNSDLHSLPTEYFTEEFLIKAIEYNHKLIFKHLKEYVTDNVCIEHLKLGSNYFGRDIISHISEELMTFNVIKYIIDHDIIEIRNSYIPNFPKKAITKEVIDYLLSKDIGLPIDAYDESLQTKEFIILSYKRYDIDCSLIRDDLIDDELLDIIMQHDMLAFNKINPRHVNKDNFTKSFKFHIVHYADKQQHPELKDTINNFLEKL